MKNILLTTIVMLLALNTQAFSKVRNDMPFICKYEGKKSFGVSQNSIRTLPVERVHNRYVVYAQTPKNTQRALFFECTFDSRGEYIRIKRTRDMRKANHSIPNAAKRYCKGEASQKWGIRNPNDIKVNSAKKIGGDDYMIRVSGRGNKGKCEVSGNGRIYLFETTAHANRPGNGGQNGGLKKAVSACKHAAQKRWRMSSSEIGADRTRRLGRDDYMIYLSARNHHAKCEASGSGRIYLFSE